MKIVAFLQNPWRKNSKYAGKPWPRESWLAAFKRSYSGKKVIKFFGHHDIWWDNSSPIVADNPNDIHPPDLEHMLKVIEKQNPDIILTFGRPARLAIDKLNIDCKVVNLPHPAYRALKNSVLEEARDNLDKYISIYGLST